MRRTWTVLSSFLTWEKLWEKKSWCPKKPSISSIFKRSKKFCLGETPRIGKLFKFKLGGSFVFVCLFLTSRKVKLKAIYRSRIFESQILKRHLKLIWSHLNPDQKQKISFRVDDYILIKRKNWHIFIHPLIINLFLLPHLGQFLFHANPFHQKFFESVSSC